MELFHIGKMIMGLGALLFLCGALVALIGKATGLRFLPGDIYFQKGSFTFYFPVVTCLLLSLVLTLVLSFIAGRR